MAHDDTLPRKRYSPRRTLLLSLFLTGCLVGLSLARIVAIQSWVLLTVLPATALSLHRRRLAVLVLVTVCGLLLGLCRGTVYMQKLHPYSQLFGRQTRMYVTAQTDGVYDDSQMSFDAAEVYIPGAGAVPGRVGIKMLGVPAVYKGDRLQVEGKLYKTRGSKQAGMSFASGSVLSRYLSPFDQARLNFSAGMRNVLPEPEASFGIGLLIGQKTSLPDNVTEDLSRVGLTHIIAVSGYNLTIIIEVVRRRLGKHSKYQSAVVSIFLIGAFMMVTGFSASIVRAAIVSTLGLWAWYYGRKVRPLLLILFTAALTAFVYPLYLWSDIGWYLSFLAFFGVLVLAPLIESRFRKRSSHSSSLIVESFSAQLMTAPLIMYIFHRFSVISLVSNMAVVPLVPLAMLLCFIAGLAGMIVPSVGGCIALPAKYLLQYMLECTALFARWSHASVEQLLSVWGMIFSYACIGIISIILWKSIQKTDTITDRNTSESEGASNVWTQ